MCGGKKNPIMNFASLFPLFSFGSPISIFISGDLKMISRTEVRTEAIALEVGNELALESLKCEKFAEIIQQKLKSDFDSTKCNEMFNQIHGPWNSF